jgi:hypothetical protein
MGAEGEPPPVKFIRVHAMGFRKRARGLRQRWAETESRTLPGPAAGRHHCVAPFWTNSISSGAKPAIAMVIRYWSSPFFSML